MENKLLQAGFTSGEIKFISHWVNKENTSYSVVLNQLKRIFVFGVIVRIFFIILCIYSFLHNPTGEFYGSLFASFIVFLAAEFFAPFKVGAKIFLYLKRSSAI